MAHGAGVWEVRWAPKTLGTAATGSHVDRSAPVDGTSWRLSNVRPIIG